METAMVECSSFERNTLNVRSVVKELLDEENALDRIVKACTLMNDIKTSSMCNEFVEESLTCMMCRYKNYMRIRVLKFAINMDINLNRTVKRLDSFVEKSYAD
jgi:hypothetical protein